MTAENAELKSFLPDETPICAWPRDAGNDDYDEWQIGVALDGGGHGILYENQEGPPGYFANVPRNAHDSVPTSPFI